MKVLCLTVERADANAVAAALPGTVAGATASWASRFEDAAQWALANPDVSAIVLDAQFGLEACGVFLNQLRRRGFTAQAILLLATGHEATASLGLDPTDMVMPRAEFLLGLPVTLADALSGRRQTAATPPPSRTILTSRPLSAAPVSQSSLLPRTTSAPAAREAASGPALSPLPLTSTAPGVSTDRLTELEAALDKAERARAAETAAAEAQLARRTRAFAATVGDLLKARETAERRLNEVALERDGLREQIESSASGAHRLAAVEADLHRAEAARETVERALAATERQLSEAKNQAAEAATAQARAEAERGAALETLAAVRRDAADADARLAREREVGAERFGRREAELSALLEQEIEKRLERETALTRAERVWQHATAEHAAALEAAERRLADAHERLDAGRKHAAAERTTLENRATEAEALAARRQHNHAAALSDLHGFALDASALDARLAELTRANEDLDHRLAEAARAQETREAEVARDRLAAAQQAVRQQERLAAQLGEAQAARAALEAQVTQRQAAVAALEAQLAEAEQVRQGLQAEHAAALIIAAAEFAQREAVREQQTRNAAALAAEQLAQRGQTLADVQAALDHQTDEAAQLRTALAQLQAEAERSRQAAAAREDAASRQREQLAELASANSGVEAQLADAQTALDALDAQLTERQATVAALQTQLTEAEGVRLALQSEHAAALFTAAAEFAQWEAVKEQAAAAATALAAEQLAQRERALADVQAALRRQTDAIEQLRADAELVRHEAEERLQQAERDLAETTERTAREREATEAQAARVEAELREQLAEASAARLVLERQISTFTDRLTHAATDGRRLDERLAAANATLATAQQTIAAQEALLDVRLGREHELNALLSSAAAAHRALDAQRLDAERATHEVEDRATRELAATSEQILDLEARLGDETALRESVERERDALQQALGSTRQQTEHQAAEYAAAIAALETATAGYQTHIASLSAQNAELEQAAEHAVARLRDDLQVAIAAHERDLEQRQAEHRSLTQRLDSVEKQRDAAREQAGQVLVLRNQLRELRTQANRQFDENPSPICRCTEQGVPQRANRAFADLLGCPPGDERVTLEYAAAQFSSSRDIAWLAERCRTRASDAAECVWKTRQGGRLTVRLHALATPDGFDLIAEDRSSVRVLEERLTRTKRLESVGRLASEVAASCGRILADVRRDAEEWIAVLGPQTQAEHRVESTLTEIARAHTLLQRLDAFAEEQTMALEPVDVHRVLRDLEPILKEIAGDDVEVLLPTRPSRRAAALLVDVQTERLERVLVNAASFGRARMPHGGTMAFELGEAIVDQPFIDRYPSARPGPHALLTITETRRPIRAIANGRFGTAAGAERTDGDVASAGLPGHQEIRHHETELAGAELAGMISEVNDESAPTDQSGVDLAPLQDLVRTCGGHLWIEAAATGNMVLKIHLPLRVPDERRWPTFGLAAFRSSGS